ncbi:DUF563 domain-containing protein [Balamuthia mandrillaris]
MSRKLAGTDHVVHVRESIGGNGNVGFGLEGRRTSLVTLLRHFRWWLVLAISFILLWLVALHRLTPGESSWPGMNLEQKRILLLRSDHKGTSIHELTETNKAEPNNDHGPLNLSSLQVYEETDEPLPRAFPVLLSNSNCGQRDDPEQFFCVNICDLSCKTQRPKEEAMPIAEAEQEWLMFRRNLTYPPVVVGYPKFIAEEDRKAFLAMGQVKDYIAEHSFSECTKHLGEETCKRINASGKYDPSNNLLFSSKKFLHGEVSLLRNAFYNGAPDANFGKMQCGPASDYHWLKPASPSHSRSSPQAVEKMVVLCGPQTFAFQHWIDRGLSKLVQVWDWVSQNPTAKVLASGQRQAVVNELWQRSGVEKTRLIDVTQATGTVITEELVFPCVAPHYHPVVYQEARRRLGILDIPSTSKARNKVVYLSRNVGKNTGRKVLNENNVRAALTNFFAARREELVIFDHSQFPSLSSVIEWFNSNAIALIGPHGGAFYNMFYCAADTLVVEFFPYHGTASDKGKTSGIRYPGGTWWPAVFTGMNYYQVPVQSASAGDIVIPIEKMLQILEKELTG